MTETARRYMGNSVPRKEDPALLTGHTRFTDEIRLPGMLHLALLRSPHAHAKVLSVDASAAKEQPGVVAVFTGEDLAEEWVAGIPTGWPVTEDIKIPDHWPLARGEVNHVGDGVAVVVATDRYRAQDALEFIEVDYEVLPAVVDVEAALEDGAPLVHEEFGTNECYTWPLGTGDIDQAFESADVVVKGRYVQQRLIPSAIEPRAVVATPEPASGILTVYSSTQVPHFVKDILAIICGVPDTKLRVVAPDVGGGFGGKLNVYAEEALALVLARKLETPIKWVEDRSENHLATTHGRGQVQHIELAAKRDGKILGMKVRLLADMGAYLQLLTPGIAIFGSFTYPGLYTFDAYSFECTGVFTNLTPTDAYRGAGRSEAAYAHERIMDDLARELDMDPAELRLKNLIPPFDEPTMTPAGVLYDSGDYETCMRKALELADYESLRAEQQRRRETGDTVQLGIGIGNFTESGGLSPSKVAAGVRLQSGGWESATVNMLASGKVEVDNGHLPARPGARDLLVPDRRRRLRRERGRRRGLPRRHRHRHLRPRHLRLAQPRGGRSRPAPRLREGRGQGQEDSGAHARSRRGGHGVRGRHVQRGRLAGPQRDDDGGGRRRVPRGQPAGGHGAGLERATRVRPAELHLALRDARLRRRGGHGDGHGEDPQVRRRRRLRPGSQPGDRGRAAARRHRPGYSPGSVRGGRLRRRRQPGYGHPGRLPRPRARPRSRT